MNWLHWNVPFFLWRERKHLRAVIDSVPGTWHAKAHLVLELTIIMNRNQFKCDQDCKLQYQWRRSLYPAEESWDIAHLYDTMLQKVCMVG